MNEDEFTKLFKEVHKVNHNLELHSAASERQHKEINSGIFELSAQVRDYHQEMILLARKVDRMEPWIHEIATKTGVQLTYDA